MGRILQQHGGSETSQMHLWAKTSSDGLLVGNSEMMKDMETEQSNADPCLYYNWTENKLALMVSWINDDLNCGK